MTDTFQKGAHTTPVDFDQIRREWAQEGFSFGIFEDPPGQEWNGFVHATDEYVLVAAGRLEIHVGAERAVAKPGDLVRIPKGVTHSLRTLSPEGSVWLYGYGQWGEA